MLGLILATAGLAQARPLIERVSFAPRSDGPGYVVRFQASQSVSAYHKPRQTDDNHFEFTIYNAALAEDYVQEKPQGPVERYTVKPSKAHLVFRFRLAPGAEIGTAAYRDRATSDLLLRLSTQGAPPLADAGDPGQPATGVSPEASSSSAGAGEARGNATRWELDTVVVDAGHGGHDPGAQAYGLDEKDVVLSIARKLGAYIEQKTDMRVVYTREHDRFVELRERGRIANKADAKLFVSIHANAARGRRAHGTETYFLGMHKTETARRVMERENSVIKLEENPHQYRALDNSAIMQSLAQSAYMRKSEQLAGLIQDQFGERVHRKDRGVKQAGFLVLWAASMPAILIETGFLTNPRDASFLGSERGQTYLASAIFRAIRDYKKQYEKGLSFTARN